MALAAVAWMTTHITAAGAQDIALQVDDYEIEGFNPLSNSRTRSILRPFTGELAGISTILEAATTLERAIQDEGYALISVIVPEQPVSGRVIRLQTQGFVIANVESTGNEHFSDQNILRSAPSLARGAHPNLEPLQRSLSVANLHPFKRVTLNFVSRERDSREIDVNLAVQDREPRQFFAWLNDTGTDDTGEYRLGLGYQHGNLFDRDHVGTFTFTTSPDQIEDVRQFGLNYRFPLYRAGGYVDLLAFDSDIDTGRVAEVFDVAGRGRTYRAAYTQLLPKRGGYSHKAYAAVADKLFDNDITFQSNDLVADVRSRPLELGYEFKWQRERVTLVNDFSWRRNLPGGEFNDEDDYDASRAGADRDWQAFAYNGSVQVTAGAWRVVGGVRAQLADEPLIAGEQFGIGGQNSVRGFEERELTGDKGYSVSLEVWAPQYRSFSFLGFVDHGRIEREDPLPGELDSAGIASAGVGMRWRSPQRHWSVRVDAAHVIDGSGPAGATQDGDSRLHFTLVYRR